MKDVGGPPGLCEDFGGDNGADPQVDLLKILPGNGFQEVFLTMVFYWMESLLIAAAAWNVLKADATKAA